MGFLAFAAFCIVCCFIACYVIGYGHGYDDGVKVLKDAQEAQRHDQL